MSDESFSMKLAKTDAGRAALAQRSLCSPRERQVMILCNGQHTMQDLLRMMGKDVLPVVTGLQLRGYVLSVSPTLVRVAELAQTTGALPDVAVFSKHSAGQSPPRAGRVVSAAVLVESSAAPSPAIQADKRPLSRVAGGSKRSLAGSKMYLLDVLRTQRSAESRHWVSRLQGVSQPHALLDESAGLITHLHQQCGARYTERVILHLLESLPEDMLAEFCSHVEWLELPDLRVLSLLVD